jgi:hypothetical protein
MLRIWGAALGVVLAPEPARSDNDSEDRHCDDEGQDPGRIVSRHIEHSFNLSQMRAEYPAF